MLCIEQTAGCVARAIGLFRFMLQAAGRGTIERSHRYRDRVLSETKDSKIVKIPMNLEAFLSDL